MFLEIAHSAPDTSEFRRQQQNSQTFHELNKVQRQILRPVPASMTDTFSLAANLKQNRDAIFKLPVKNGIPRGQDKQFSDAHLPGAFPK